MFFQRSQAAIALKLMCLAQVFIWTGTNVAQEKQPNDFSGPIKIAKLLWNANSKSAGSTLARSIHTAFERDSLDTLVTALQPLQPFVQDVADHANTSDPRFAPAVAAIVLLAPSDSAASRLQATLELLERADEQRLDDRELLFRVWLHVDQATAIACLKRTLTRETVDPQWSAVMMRECLDRAPQIATQTILSNWANLPEASRLAAIEPLSSSAVSMTALTEAVGDGTISKDLVNTNQLRKWMAAGNVVLAAKIESIWGKIRESDNVERQALVAKTIQLFNSQVSGSASRGNKVFTRVCSQCHQLHGQGYEVGPNITNNGRGKLEQLVSNVLDPSLVIGEAFQARTILTVDGEVIAGLVAAENNKYLKIKVQGGKVIEFDKAEDIEQIKISDKSLMPEGLESQLTQQELIDLFAYLCLLKPLEAADNELIPGTPEGFVEP